jgi:hypothetical protein
LQYRLLLVGDEEVEEENREEEEPIDHSVFTHGTQFEYHDEIYELFSIFIERITAVPVGDTNEDNAIYFISAQEKLQLEELIDSYN